MNELPCEYVTRVSFFMNSLVTFPHKSLEFTRNIVDDLDDQDEMKRVCQHLVGVLQARLVQSATTNVDCLVYVAKDLQVSQDPYIKSAGACLERAIQFFEESYPIQN